MLSSVSLRIAANVFFADIDPGSPSLTHLSSANRSEREYASAFESSNEEEMHVTASVSKQESNCVRDAVPTAARYECQE